MNLIINGKKIDVPAVSKLSFRDFSKIIVDHDVYDLKKYIAMYSGLEVNDLMNAEVKTFSVKALHAAIFDIDIEKKMKKPPKVFVHNNEYFTVKELSLKTFGKKFMFDHYYERFQLKQINAYEMGVYCLATALAEKYDSKEIQTIYDDLVKQPWTEILPTAFFLAKRSLRKKKNSTLMYLTFMLGLKIIQLKRQFRTSTSSITGKR